MHLFLLYFVAWSLMALTPGPAVMCAMSSATRYGFRQALVGIVGIQLGHLVFFGCVASGLAALLATTSTAFAALRVVGAIYLFYLGVRILLFPPQKSADSKTTRTYVPSHRNLILQGFAIQVTNPKALVFMSAFLPHFLDPNHTLWIQFLVLLAITIAVDTLVLSGYAYIARRGTQSIRDSRSIRWLERTCGAALIFFGIRLLWTARK